MTDHAREIGEHGSGDAESRLPRRAVVGLLGAAAVLCALMAAPTLAEATSVSYTRADIRAGGFGDGAHDVTYHVDGQPGENNDISVSANNSGSGGSSVTIKENNLSPGMTVSDPLGICDVTAPREVTCLTFLNSGGNAVNLDVALGDGTDRFVGPTGAFSWADEAALVYGGTHDDNLNGGGNVPNGWPAWLFGEGGDDILRASVRPNNALIGGSGFDILDAKGNGADALIDCGGSGASTNDGRARVDSTDPEPDCSAGAGDGPSVTIDNGPGSGSGAVVNQTTADFEFSSEPGARFECRQYVSGDAPPEWSGCDSPEHYDVVAGDHIEHTFEGRATDFAGFTGGVTSYTWVVDTVAPDTKVFPLGGIHVTNDSTPELPEFGSDAADVDHFECRVDGAGAWRVCTSGGQWPGPALSDGEHAIAIRAVDAAGNPDGEPDEQKYLIDSTPPDVAFDNGQNPSGAETVRANYTENGSGFKSAQILARLRNSGDEWKALPTAENAGALSARLDSLKPGAYEFEARVTDKATNVGISNQTESGTDLVLEITLLGTRVGLGYPGSASGSATLDYGHSGQVTGTLRSATGTPLTGQTLRLVETFYAGSAQESRTRTYRTDPRGEISANLPPGPSREIELVYPGAGRYQSSRSEELELEVNGSVSLKAKRKVRAGRKVKFKGLVPHEGALLPAGGKLVEVQVRVGRQWRAVTGSKRTRSNGRYKLKYRFGRFYTRPTRFKFRTKVVPEQGWPFVAPVYSNLRKVKVLPGK